MKKQDEEQLYTFEEFDKHISLYNSVPQGDGNSLVMLRKICDGIHSQCFERNPSIIIAGDNARAYSLALANTLCSDDVRYYQARYLCTVNSLMECFRDSLPDTIHIIQDPKEIGGCEGTLWSIINKREYKFTSYDRKRFEHIYVHGLIILVTDNLPAVPSPITKSVDFKIVINRCSQIQLQLIVHQKLRFCSVDYLNNEEVLKTIAKQGAGIDQVMEFLKVCILIAKTEQKPLNMALVNRVIRLVSVGAPPIDGQNDGIPF
jgi:hypothetical protein